MERRKNEQRGVTAKCVWFGHSKIGEKVGQRSGRATRYEDKLHVCSEIVSTDCCPPTPTHPPTLKTMCVGCRTPRASVPREEFTLGLKGKCSERHTSGGRRLGARGGLHAVQKRAINRIMCKWGPRARPRTALHVGGGGSLTRWCARMGVYDVSRRLKKKSTLECIIKIKVIKIVRFISLTEKSVCKKHELVHFIFQKLS
jgi:hypothetical protein